MSSKHGYASSGVWGFDRAAVAVLRTPALATALALAACGGNAATNHAHWLRIADGSGDLTSLNPHLAMGASLDDVSQLTQAYLMRYDRNGRLEPELAIAVPTRANDGVSADGRTITWHLRRGVRWSDGAPFDARDVVFSTRAILNPKNDEVQGTEGWRLIDRIAAPDAHTVVFHLRRPYGALVPMAFGTAGAGPSLLPQHLLGRLPDIERASYNALPIGIGPFRIVRWKRGDAIEMEANPFYWRGRPKLQRISYVIVASRETLVGRMRAGDVDLWPRVPPTYAAQLMGDATVRVTNRPSLRTTHLDFSMAPTALADRSVRRAIRLAIDRRALVRTVEHGRGLLTDHIVWPPAPALRDDPHLAAWDPARARTLLDADGWRTGPSGLRSKDGRALVLRLAYQAGSPDVDTIVELIRAELAAIGIGIDAHTYTHALLFAPKAEGGILANGRFDATIYASTIVTLPDFASNFDCAQAPPNGENYARWCDARVEALLAEMRASSDPRAIARSFATLDRIFVDEAPSIQLFVWTGGDAQSTRLRGYAGNLLTSFDDMMNVDI